MNNNEKILPIPYIGAKEKTVKDWFQTINERLDGLKAEVLGHKILGNRVDMETIPNTFKEYIAESATETITAITSMLEAMGIDEKMRQEAQKLTNKKAGRFIYKKRTYK